MANFIKKLKKEPREIRKIIVSVATVVLTGVIVLFWAFTLPYQLGTGVGKKTAMEEELRPISLLKDDLRAMVGEASRGVKSIKKEAGIVPQEGEVILYPQQ